MYIIIDILLVVLLIFFLYSGYKQGFIKSGIGFICFAVSFVLASILSPIIFTYVYDDFISKVLISKANDVINVSSYSLTQKAVSIMKSLPQFLTNNISASDVSRLLLKGDDPAKELSNMMEPIVSNILTPIILIIVTTVFTFAFNFILKRFRKVTKNLSIGKVDSIIGLAFGGLKYTILIFIVTLSLKSIMPLCSENVSSTVAVAINDSIIAQYLVNFDFRI